MQSLHDYLASKFRSWRPPPPTAVPGQELQLSWSPADSEFGYLHRGLLYRVHVRDRTGWRPVYLGAKTSKVLSDVSPCHPHQFRVQVILRDTAVPTLVDLTLLHYGGEHQLRQHLGTDQGHPEIVSSCRWLESRWSEGRWCGAGAGCSSALCFSLAVRVGDTTQVLSMLEERPALIDIVNASTGLSPLDTAVRKGDLTMVKLLVESGADVEGGGRGGRPLHLALGAARPDLAACLVGAGADLKAPDINGLTAEHHAVSSLECVRLVEAAGAEWTAGREGALYRAVLLNSPADVVEYLRERERQTETEKEREGR